MKKLNFCRDLFVHKVKASFHYGSSIIESHATEVSIEFRIVSIVSFGYVTLITVMCHNPLHVNQVYPPLVVTRSSPLLIVSNFFQLPEAMKINLKYFCNGHNVQFYESYRFSVYSNQLAVTVFAHVTHSTVCIPIFTNNFDHLVARNGSQLCSNSAIKWRWCPTLLNMTECKCPNIKYIIRLLRIDIV